MSTAVAEAPKTVETPPATPAAETPPPRVDIQSLLRPTIVKDGKVMNPAVKEAPKEKAPDAPKDGKEAKEQPKEAPKQTDADKNFAAIRAKLEEAEKRHAEYEARIKNVTEEYETFKKNPVPKEYEERLTKAEKERQEYQERLRVTDLSRDPAFQRKYNEPISAAMEAMTAAATAAGIDAKEVQQAINGWNEDRFGEWLESMPPREKLRFQSAYGRAMELDTARNQELANSEQAMAELEKSRAGEHEAAQKRYLDALKDDKKAILSDLAEKQEIFKTDEGLRKEVEGLLDKSAGLNGEKLSARQMLGMIANAHVLARHFQRVEKEKGELAVQLEAAQKELESQKKILADMNGSFLPINPTGGAKTGKEEASDIVNAILKPKIRT